MAHDWPFSCYVGYWLFREAVYTSGAQPAIWGLISGIAYFAIVYDIDMGEAKLAVASGGAVEAAHNTLVKFVVIGWAIYPIGYMAGTVGLYGGVGEFFGILLQLDVIYNIGDAINKIGFGLLFTTWLYNPNNPLSLGKIAYEKMKKPLIERFFYLHTLG